MTQVLTLHTFTSGKIIRQRPMRPSASQGIYYEEWGWLWLLAMAEQMHLLCRHSISLIKGAVWNINEITSEVWGVEYTIPVVTSTPQTCIRALFYGCLLKKGSIWRDSLGLLKILVVCRGIVMSNISSVSVTAVKHIIFITECVRFDSWTHSQRDSICTVFMITYWL